MEIINQNKSLPIFWLMLFKSFCMFCTSFVCGWIILNLFPDWIELDFLFSAKISVAGILLFGWLLAYPKFICQKNWGLVFISFLGGIFCSILLMFFGFANCLFAFAITNLGLFGGILIGNYCQNKISASLFIKIVAAIFILMFLLYIFSVYKSGTFLIYQPAYLAFSLLAWLHLIYVCSKKEQIISELLSSQEKRAYHKFVIFFFLNFMALAPFIDCSRIVVLIYFQFLHLFNVNHK